MSGDTWRFLPFDVNHGAFQMATDAVLAQSGPDVPVLRFYLWEPFALSLGRHQSEDLIKQTACENAEVDVVRRPTGGRAVFRAEELTYAVILPTDHPVAEGGTRKIHERISQAVASGLNRLDLGVTLEPEVPNLKEHYKNKTRSFPCFSTSTQYELQIDGKKIVGSAQRKYPGAVLQHGSILMGNAHTRLPQYLNLSETDRKKMAQQFKEKTTELNNHLPEAITPFGLTHAIMDGFREYFQCDMETVPLSESELREIRSVISHFSLFSTGQPAQSRT